MKFRYEIFIFRDNHLRVRQDELKRLKGKETAANQLKIGTAINDGKQTRLMEIETLTERVQLF